MKKLLSLLLGILLMTGCAATYDGSTVEKPVLSEHTVQYYSNFFGSTDMLYTTRATYAYDIYGNMVRTQEYRDGELESVTSLRYDDRGNLISETTWDHTGWVPLISRREKRTYDDRNRLLSSVTYNFWGCQTGGSWYTYDDETRTRVWTNGEGDIQTTWFDKNGYALREVSDVYETVYEYDDRGNRTGWVSYKDGALSDSYRVRYDDQNRQIWGAHYDASGNLRSESEYSYDDEAHTMTHRRPDGQVRCEYYLPDGRLSRIEDYNTEGDISLIQKYTYRDIRIPAKEE